VYPIKGKYSTATIMTDEVDIDENVYKQILGFVNNHVFTNDSKIMPDYHYGAGGPIGFTMEMTDRVIPFLIGVDIGCNMLFVDFQKSLDFDKKQWLAVDRQIRKVVPMSDKYRDKPAFDIQKEYP
jgi:RNA-splicing ligase RtcB